EDVISVVEAVAGREHGYQSSAVVEAVAKRFSVCEGAVWLLPEHMVEPADATISDALNLGQLSGEHLIEGALEAGDHPDPDALPEGAEIRNGATGETIEYVESEIDD
ncbi:hypothetical protein, partial [Microbispora corallina]|uniref:hypothetical protein n=1 Tax=Microbispora corallina TaxID=83302 RepID=UPI0031E13C96